MAIYVKRPAAVEAFLLEHNSVSHKKIKRWVNVSAPTAGYAVEFANDDEDNPEGLYLFNPVTANPILVNVGDVVARGSDGNFFVMAWEYFKREFVQDIL